ncbi:DUF4184 family protein [Flavobacterium sp.]|uniref:DUF4184 family protein n=1 Tax=Flavobacterium sp. TaxID=239 RepID=UPI0025C4A86B|nr:DUF4184 family protein [Flavobacterium sp.]
MPFTFTHPAIILPLTHLPRKWFSLTGLIIGSLTPDFEYFIRMKIQSNYSHTFYGIFWFDLPLAILLSFIFHNVIRNDLFMNSPPFIKSRILTFTSFNWNNYFKNNWYTVLASILIGIISHLVWDSFTHQSGYFVEHISLLKRTIRLWGNTIPLWKIMQHSSTLIGAVILTISFRKLHKESIRQNPINFKYWTAIILFILLISILRFSIPLSSVNLGNLIATLISAFFISLSIIPILIKSRTS